LIATEKIELLQIKEVLLRDDSQEVIAQVIPLPERELKEQADSQISDYLIIEDRVKGLIISFRNAAIRYSVTAFLVLSLFLKE
jgi:hypothetical protein